MAAFITHVGDGVGGCVWHLLRLIRESEALIRSHDQVLVVRGEGGGDGVFLIESEPKQPTYLPDAMQWNRCSVT